MNLNDMLKKTYGKKLTSNHSDKANVTTPGGAAVQNNAQFPVGGQSAVPPVSDASTYKTDNAPVTVRPVSWSSLQPEIRIDGSGRNTNRSVTAAGQKNAYQSSADNVTDGFVKTTMPQITPHVAGNVPQKPGAVPAADSSIMYTPIEKGGSTYNRVAKFLMLIGSDEAAKILSKLPQEQCEKIALELACIREIPPEESSSILAEFGSLAERAGKHISGGVETARTILEKAFGAEQGEHVLHKAVPDADGKPFDFITELDKEKLLFLLHNESTAVQAIVLSYVPPPLAAHYIKSLDDASRKDVILRLGKMKKIERDVVMRIDSVMREKSEQYVADRPEQIDGRSVLARILNSAEYDKSVEILNGLQNSDEKLAADIRTKMFGCDRIPGCFGRGFEELLSTMTDNDIAVLIHDKTAEFRQTVYDAVSKNRQRDIAELEDMLAERQDAWIESGSITAQFLHRVRAGLADGTIFDSTTKIIRS